MYLSLLDEAAARFKGLLNSGESTKSVMVVTSLNPQKKGGNLIIYFCNLDSISEDTIIILSSDHLYLNSTAATKFYFGNNLAAITEFTMRYKSFNITKLYKMTLSPKKLITALTPVLAMQ